MSKGKKIEAQVTFDASDPEWAEKLKAGLADKLEGMDGARRKANGQPPVKNTPEDQAVSDKAYGIAADELRQLIEQYEGLEAEKKDITERMKEVMAEAKARGYDTKVLKLVVALRKRSKDDIDEESAILDMYLAALGMA